MKINTELSEVVGTFIGDGFTNVYKKSYITEFTGHPTNDYEYYTTIIIPMMRYLFPCKPCLTFRSKSLRLRYNSKQLHIFLTKVLNLPVGKKSSSITIPKIFLNRKANLKAVLHGIFDTDGSIIWDVREIYKTPYPRLSITTKSKSLAYQLMCVLKKLKFTPCLYTDRWNKLVAYHIDMYGKKQLKKWIEEIGFSNSNHISRLMPQ